MTPVSLGSSLLSSWTMRTARSLISGGYLFDPGFFPSMTPTFPRFGASRKLRPVHWLPSGWISQPQHPPYSSTTKGGPKPSLVASAARQSKYLPGLSQTAAPMHSHRSSFLALTAQSFRCLTAGGKSPLSHFSRTLVGLEPILRAASSTVSRSADRRLIGPAVWRPTRPSGCR